MPRAPPRWVRRPAGRVTEICTVVVRPTNSGSVPRGAAESGADTFQRLGFVPRAPRAVGFLGTDLRRGAGQVFGGQRNHRERGVLVDLADGLAAAEPGQRLLSELRRPACRLVGCRRRGVRSTAHGSITTVAAIAVNSSDGAGRRHSTARCYVCVSCYQCFDTVVAPTNATPVVLQRHRRARRHFCGAVWLQDLRCPAGWLRRTGGAAAGRAAAAAGTAEVAAAAASAAWAPAGLTADMIAGIKTPLSRSIAWPAPS